MTNEVKDQAVKLISESLGEVTAKSYAEFYKDKNDEIVKASVQELLIEVLGERKALEKMKGLL